MLFVNLFFSFENNFATEYASLNAAYLKLYLLSWFVEERMYTPLHRLDFQLTHIV